MPEKTEAQKKAQKKYMEKKAPIQLVTDPQKREEIKLHAESMGENMSKFIFRAIEQQMKRDKTGDR